MGWDFTQAQLHVFELDFTDLHSNFEILYK